MTAHPEDAVVVGAGMAGLLCARVLAERFARVTLVERDELPDRDEHRPGVPQDRHAHGLLASGARIIEELLPGVRQELVEAGAARRDAALQGRWFNRGAYTCQVATGLEGVAATRPVLEGHVRRRVLALPNVTVRTGLAARGLLSGADGRVAGVVVRSRGGGSDAPLGAGFVVDASGRGSRAPAWLEALGYPAPALDRVGVGLGYATRLYRRAPRDLDGDVLLNVAAQPPNPRLGVALAVEGNRWLVTLAGLLGVHPPTDPEGFLAFAARLPTPDLHALIRDLEPLRPAVRTRFPVQRRLRYERLRRLPDGFVVLGDALASFNPVYGQGMSVAAQQATLLGRLLDAHRRPGLPHRFYRGASRRVDVPWNIAVGNDLRFPAVDGPRPLHTRVVNRYLDHLIAAAAHDSEVAGAFFRVGHLVSPPATLLHPRIARRVLARRVTAPFAAPTTDASVVAAPSPTSGPRHGPLAPDARRGVVVPSARRNGQEGAHTTGDAAMVEAPPLDTRV